MRNMDDIKVTTPDLKFRRKLITANSLSPRCPKKLMKVVLNLRNCASNRHSVTGSSSSSEGKSSQLLSVRHPDNIRPGQFLSEYEKLQLLKSWKILESGSLAELGRRIYSRIFHEDPSLMIVFSWHVMTIDDLMSTESFQRQVRAMTQLLGHNIKHLETLTSEENMTYLFFVGRKHKRYKSFGFEAIHWQIFRRAIVNAVCCTIAEKIATQKKPHELLLDQRTLRETWDKLIAFIVDTLESGFNEAMSRHPKPHTHGLWGDATRHFSLQLGKSPASFEECSNYQSECTGRYSSASVTLRHKAIGLPDKTLGTAKQYDRLLASSIPNICVTSPPETVDTTQSSSCASLTSSDQDEVFSPRS